MLYHKSSTFSGMKARRKIYTIKKQQQQEEKVTREQSSKKSLLSKEAQNIMQMLE